MMQQQSKNSGLKLTTTNTGIVELSAATTNLNHHLEGIEMNARLTDPVHLSPSNTERTATRKAMTTTAMIIFSTSLSICKVHSIRQKQCANI
mmetsp:Transcript_21127/g.33131  ORF Transcript_21127/g.33131 Transcript_21127/m.33131 type:complete len:92 (-) Transcript_21127:5737-6012(-)